MLRLPALAARKRSELTRAFDQDLPRVPTHWHELCDCKPTVAYIRVSKIGKRTTIKSPQIQMDEIIADARRNGRRIVKVVFDLNQSGENFDRLALEEVLDDVRGAEYRHISVWKWSRWGRNLRGSLEMLALVEELDARVDSATEPFDQETVWGEFGRDQMLLIASLQSKVIGETWKGVHNTRIEAQLPHNGRKRFGYVYVVENERDKHFELHEAESEILEWAYGAYLTNTSMRQIAKTFNERGFRTEFGGLWTYQAVGKMMDTGFAAGWLRMRSDEQKKAMKKRPANSLRSYDRWEPGKQPQIIDLDTWNRYKAKRLGQTPQPAKNARIAHKLSSLCFCSICSRRLATHWVGKVRPGKGRTLRWECRASIPFHPDQSNGIRNEDVMPIVLDWLANRAQPEWVEHEARRIVLSRSSAGEASQIDQLRRELREADNRAQAMLELYAAGQDRSEAARARVMAAVTQSEERAQSLRAQIARLEAAPTPEPDWVAMRGLVADWDSYGAGFRQAALSRVIGMIVISPPLFKRSRFGLEGRVRIVPVWEMDEWSEWLEAARSTMSA